MTTMEVDQVIKYLDGGVGVYIVDSDGNEWYYNKVGLHRDNGPAVIYTDGSRMWYSNGKCHRTDGPAVEGPYGRSWFLNGVEINCSSQEEFDRLINVRAFL